MAKQKEKMFTRKVSKEEVFSDFDAVLSKVKATKPPKWDAIKKK